jgi:hypothetical protein
LLRVVLNSTSFAEAHLALCALKDSVPEKALVAAVNVREMLRELPACPFRMGVELETLLRVTNFRREKNTYRRSHEDSEGSFELIIVAEGNYCWDILISMDGENTFWAAPDRGEDLVNPQAIDLIVARKALLGEVVSLIRHMDMPFAPTFYLSIDDWNLEYMESVVEDVCAFLDEPPPRRRRAPDRRKPPEELAISEHMLIVPNPSLSSRKSWTFSDGDPSDDERIFII